MIFIPVNSATMSSRLALQALLRCVLLAILFSAPILKAEDQQEEEKLAELSDGFADTADEATVEALNKTGEDAKILSVSEQDDFFKVKVLVEGKVKVIRIPKPDGA